MQANSQPSVSCQANVEQKEEVVKTQPQVPNTKQNSSLGKTPREKALFDNKKFSLIFLIVAIVSAVLSIVFDKIDGDATGTIAMIFMWIFLISCILTIVVVLDRKRIKRSYCPHCGEKYDYEDDIAWEVSNVTIFNSDKRADVKFQCVCANCGEETFFTKNFKIAYFQNGKYIEKNIRTEAKNYFK